MAPAASIAFTSGVVSDPKHAEKFVSRQRSGCNLLQFPGMPRDSFRLMRDKRHNGPGCQRRSWFRKHSSRSCGRRMRVPATVRFAAPHGGGMRHRAIRRHRGHRTIRRTGRGHSRCAGWRSQHRLNRQKPNHNSGNELKSLLHSLCSNVETIVLPVCERNHIMIRPCPAPSAIRKPPYFAAVRALTGTSMSSLRITRLVAFSEASSKPCPWVIASVGQASTQ